MREAVELEWSCAGVEPAVRDAVFERDKVCPLCGLESGLVLDRRTPVGGCMGLDLLPADFQLLHSEMQDAKRGHCEQCVVEDKRFDASLMGQPVRWLEGGEKRTEHGCVGCYWYDVRGFFREMGRSRSEVKATAVDKA